MATITRALAGLSLMTIVACARPSVAIAPDSMDELHAAVLDDAAFALNDALDDTSRALPPMSTLAEREGAIAQQGGASTPALEEEGPPKGDVDGARSEDGAKAKSAPPTGPSGVRPPLSASEAAEQNDQNKAAPLPSSSATTPEPVSPKAPPELWNPPTHQRP